MKKNILYILSVLIYIHAFGQKSQTFNLNFEESQKKQPTGWENFGSSSYIIALDSTVFQNGHKSVSITSGGESDFKAWAYNIPAKYEGKKIKLTGYIKTENVADGYAGLWMRIDPNVAFNNMNDRGIKGTTDWKQYEITLNLKPSNAMQIVVGGLLVGKGKMWIDNLKITIDGKPLSQAPLKQLLPAEKDTAFNSGSKIETTTLTKMKTEDLKTLGLIWGFLKYHHPNIAAGKYNWDYELFRIIPRLSSVKTSVERDKILNSWIIGLGDFKAGIEKKIPDEKVKMQPDLDWIKKSGFSKDLTATLLKVKNAQRNGRQFYIGLYSNVGNPEFLHENPYPDMKYPDAGFRLLALYRYWNSIQYFFPYKYLIEEDWKEALSEFIPKFLNAPDELTYKLTALEIIARIHDTHANIWNDTVLTKYKGVNFSAVKINFVENKAVVTGFYDDEIGNETGLQKGDVISHVNDKLVDYIVKDLLKYTPASNYPAQLRDIAANLLRSNDSVLNISYVREGVLDYKKLKLYPQNKINLYKKSQSKDTCFKFINPKIAYIYPGTIKNDYLPKIMKEVENTSGLIIDLRCYPSEFVVFSLGGYLKPDKTLFAKFTNANLENPGQFAFRNTVENGGAKKETYKGKIVILINETTQSQAEYTAMAFSNAPNVTVIGSTTAGADGNVSSFTLPGNISTMISGLGVYYPDGKETQRIGIIPDVEIKPTVAGIRDGKDEVLEKAIEIIGAN